MGFFSCQHKHQHWNLIPDETSTKWRQIIHNLCPLAPISWPYYSRTDNLKTWYFAKFYMMSLCHVGTTVVQHFNLKWKSNWRNLQHTALSSFRTRKKNKESILVSLLASRKTSSSVQQMSHSCESWLKSWKQCGNGEVLFVCVN